MKVEAHPTEQYVFQINQSLKTSRPGKHFSHLVLQSYPEDKQLSVCEVLQAYLERKMRKNVGEHNNDSCGMGKYFNVQ